MTIFDMLEQSGVMTLLGMGVVFGFLVLLVVSISLVGKIIQAFNLNKPVQSAVLAVQKPEETGAITAAISAAVNEYRKNNK